MDRLMRMRPRMLFRRQALLALSAISVTVGCGRDPVAPVLLAGTYELTGSPWSGLPLNVRASQDAETVLTSGDLEIGSAPATTSGMAGRLTLRVSDGPIGGPHTPGEIFTIDFTATQRGRQLILSYLQEPGGAPAQADTLEIRGGGLLRGDVHVPNSAAGRLTLVFDYAGEL